MIPGKLGIRFLEKVFKKTGIPTRCHSNPVIAEDLLLSLECIHLHKSFGKKPVLTDIHFKVEPGEILYLIGPNGAGKTTLLKILATLSPPTRGRALVCGVDVAPHSMQPRRWTGYVPSEDRSFYWRLTGRQNLVFFASLHGLGKKECQERIDLLLGEVGLEESADRPFREYSSGMRQALGIARALLHNPVILLMDEPSRSLSPERAAKVRNLIKRKASGGKGIVLIASHDLREMEDLATGIAIIHKGALKARGTLEQLKAGAGLPESASPESVYQYYTHMSDQPR